MRPFACDLHIHSTLSPCASLEMSPKNIALSAKKASLDIIAVTDHNMVENAIYTHEWGQKLGLTVLFGMELQTQEEIHLLVLFEESGKALQFQKEVYERLPDVENVTDYFGDQVVVDSEDNIVRFERRLLLNSVQVSLEDAVARAKFLRAMVIPSHIDSPHFSIISQLGYIPEHLHFDALEVRSQESIAGILPLIINKNLPFVTFSDAHYLKDIGKRRTALSLQAPCLYEIGAALRKMG